MIRVTNWSSHQSYKDRRPPWIRFHKTMLDNYEFHMMSAEARALLPMLWLLASEDEDPVSGLIQDSYERITFRLRMDLKTFKDCIDEIEQAGFLEVLESKGDSQCNEVVTNPYPVRNKTVTPETETETETETERGCDFDLIIDLYNQVAQRHDLPIAQKLTNARKSKIRARLKDCGGMDGWKSALEKLERSDFCLGKNNSGWRADLDFILQESSFTKLMEGTYDNTNTATSKTNRAKEAIIKSRGDSLNAYPL